MTIGLSSDGSPSTVKLGTNIFMKKEIVSKSQRAEVRRYIDKWGVILFLQQWDFTVVYQETLDDGAAAEVQMHPEYKNATIFISASQFFSADKREREEMVVHELCHAVLQPMVHVACEGANGRQVSQKEIDWFKESVTQHFARAIFYK